MLTDSGETGRRETEIEELGGLRNQGDQKKAGRELDRTLGWESQSQRRENE